VSALQAVALLVVVVGGTAVALTPDPLRQTLLLSIYGMALAILFFVFEAPDVALSEIVVSGVGMPVIVLAALRKLAQQRARRDSDEEPSP
jgi:energy-converting hydrogenase B subunit D